MTLFIIILRLTICSRHVSISSGYQWIAQTDLHTAPPTTIRQICKCKNKFTQHSDG